MICLKIQRWRIYTKVWANSLKYVTTAEDRALDTGSKDPNILELWPGHHEEQGKKQICFFGKDIDNISPGTSDPNV